MVCSKTMGQADSAEVRQVDVTDMAPDQRRELFRSCFDQDGFTGFIKSRAGKQTYYIFYYKNGT